MRMGWPAGWNGWGLNKGGNLVVTPREQVDTEQVGVPGGERSELAQSEQKSGASGS